MPSIVDVKTSWADEVELEGGVLPPPTEVYENNLKIVTEYKMNEDNKKIKCVRTYKIEKCIVSKSIALRKTWRKFGDSAGDKPGPSSQTTMVAEDVFMQFITNKEEEKTEEVVDKLKNIRKCRTCNGDHWTVQCMYKDTMLGGPKPMDSAKISGAADAAGGATGDKYVPPSRREGAKLGGPSNIRRDDATAIRITNLSEATMDSDLEDLVKPFGQHSKMYLARDKVTGVCKGFAYVHFKFAADAARAIAGLDGYGYDHLILKVDWSKPAAQQGGSGYQEY
ncbi:eukaryotic translation initiation factor 3 subunit G isoform X2 [Ctenocephalides felis]|uniref:eukaryotic translation initiation factor 3 subunit G isoform X2 n=1 Tax=Ctenocephalides felis TaxID=7515 RepID=UPI000E6E5707|nr:eukaryotic translation initiation factor 3 subunit G isoform X2 [Ctenocephalides felis]